MKALWLAIAYETVFQALLQTQGMDQAFLDKLENAATSVFDEDSRTINKTARKAFLVKDDTKEWLEEMLEDCWENF